MRRTTRLLLLVGVCVVGALGGTWKYQAYRQRSAALAEETERYRVVLEARDRNMEDRAKVLRGMRKVAGTTLGSDEEKATSVLRKALNEVVSHYRLADATVTSSRPVALKNPAAQRGVMELSDKKWKDAKGTPDFYVLPATINGKGTLDQVTRVLATLQAQAWVHRIDGFSIKPIGKERERVELTVTLATIYLTDPGLLEKPVGEGVSWSPVSETRYALWQPLVAKNVFREPAPVAAAPAAPTQPTTVAAAQPLPPSPPPYDQWRVSGITRGAAGPELMVMNLQTKEWRTLQPGGVILEAKFVDASGEVARISIGDKEFEVKTGQRLSDRTPLTR